ncbi:hypothetical protein, partial [Tritonibacter mobilis]|uniref:hypothetical protein n=1 Tax=Tritonibacter mobilis TaxID=379347 RepID=UPI0019506592
IATRDSPSAISFGVPIFTSRPPVCIDQIDRMRTFRKHITYIAQQSCASNLPRCGKILNSRPLFDLWSG